MKKIFTFLFSVILTMSCVNVYAQNPYCKWDSKHGAGSVTNITDPIINNVGAGCNFLFVLKDPESVCLGWWPDDAIVIAVDGVDYGFVTLPYGLGNCYAEEIVSLPSGKVELLWAGDSYDPLMHCFKIYNSSNELIYESSYPEGALIPREIFFTYQNECSECIPLTDLEGIHIHEIKQVELTWKAPESTYFTGFEIYRNEELIEQLPPATVSYSDNTEELENGDYKYCVVPVYPFVCDLEETCVTIPIDVGINNFISTLQIYPNPANEIVTIYGANIASVKVLNSMGQHIHSYLNINSVNVSSYNAGIYFFNITTTEGNIGIYKITIIK